MRRAAVEVREVSKVYGEGASAARALNKVDLDIHAGEVTLLMGPSGSGKTTLLSIMGCILKPTAGGVRIAGRDVAHLAQADLPSVRLNYIGFVFQSFNLFPALTAAENVAIGLHLKGIRGAEARKRSRELLEQVNLADKSDAFPADLSGGQKQRVAIARAVAGAPEIILADEPTAALDKSSGRVVMDMLRGLATNNGRAIAIVTHDGRMEEYADRIVRIEDGRIVSSVGRYDDEAANFMVDACFTCRSGSD